MATGVALLRRTLTERIRHCFRTSIFAVVTAATTAFLASAQCRRFLYALARYYFQTSIARSSKKIAALTLTLVAAITAFLALPRCRRFLYALTRLALIQLLSVWDWTQLHDSECLVPNPFHHDLEGLRSADCEACSNWTSPHFLQDVSQKHFTSYLVTGMPAVVTDAASKWRAGELFNEAFLLEAFEANEKLADKKQISCHMMNSVIPRSVNVKYILKRVVVNKISSWFAFWENCDVDAAKMVRRYYDRPYFLPPMTELQKSNWLFMSNSFSHPEDAPVLVSGQMVWFAQIKGVSDITIVAKAPCDAVCQSHSVSLKAGEALVYTTALWEARFKPSPEGLSVALATGGIFF